MRFLNRPKRLTEKAQPKEVSVSVKMVVVDEQILDAAFKIASNEEQDLDQKAFSSLCITLLEKETSVKKKPSPQDLKQVRSVALGQRRKFSIQKL